MDAYALHLAMAALVGASFVAVSAYYMHRKTLSQLLEFARAMEHERKRDPPAADEEDTVLDKRLPQRHSAAAAGQAHRPRRALQNGYYRRGSASLPDVKAADIDEEVEGNDREERWPSMANGQLLDDIHQNGMLIPPGLPRLHTVPEGNKQSVHANSYKRAGHVMKPTSPKSPGASVSAFGSVEGSDDEQNMNDESKLDSSYLHSGNLEPDCNGIFQTLPDDIAANGDAMELPSSSMIRSHSVSGDLHGVQPDPVAADILRKEPEQETFARLNIAPRSIFLWLLIL